MLESFGLRDRRAYAVWWTIGAFTNDHVSLGPRFRWVCAQLPESPALLLEIGCQTGGFTIPLLQAGYQVTAVDIVSHNLIAVREKAMGAGVDGALSVLLSFAEELDFRDCFDAVLLCEVLIHVPDDRLVLQRAFEAVKPGGRLIMTVPWADLFQGVEISRHYNLIAFAAALRAVAGGDLAVTALCSPGEVSPHTLAAVVMK